MPCQQLYATPAPRVRRHRPGVARQLHALHRVEGSNAIVAISAPDAAFRYSLRYTAGIGSACDGRTCPANVRAQGAAVS